MSQYLGVVIYDAEGGECIDAYLARGVHNLAVPQIDAHMDDASVVVAEEA